MGTISLAVIVLLVMGVVVWQIDFSRKQQKKAEKAAADIMSKSLVVLRDLAVYYDGRHIVNAQGHTLRSKEATAALVFLYEQAKLMKDPQAELLVTPTDIEDYDWERKSQPLPSESEVERLK